MDSNETQTAQGQRSPWLRAAEASKYLRCGVRGIYRAVAKGELRAARLNGRRDLVMKRAWLDEFLERRAQNTEK